MLHRWPSLNRLAEVWEPAADPDNAAAFADGLQDVRSDDTAMVAYCVARMCRDEDTGAVLAKPPNPYQEGEPEFLVWERALLNGLTVEGRLVPMGMAA